MNDLLENRIFEGWHSSESFFGKLSSAEAKFERENNNVYLGVGINIGFEGNYHFRIKGSETAYLIKKTDYNYVLKRIDLTDEQKPKANILKLKISVVDNKIIGFIDDIEIISYALDEKLIFEKGFGGAWIHPEKSAKICGFDVEGDLEIPIKTKTQISKKVYSFSDNENPRGWYFNPKFNGFKANNASLSSENSGYFESTLHLFSKNFVTDFIFSTENAKNSGEFGFFARKSPDTAYLKCRYNFSDRIWTFSDVPALYDCDVFEIKSDVFDLSNEKEHFVHIEAFGDVFKLFVDSKLIFSINDIRHNNFGKFSFFSNDVKLTISKFKTESENSTEVQDGLLQYVIEKPDTPVASTEIIETPDKKLLGIRKILPEKTLYGFGSTECVDKRNPESRGILESHDNGYSFSDIPFGGVYKDLITGGAYQSLIKLKNGKYLQVKISENYAVKISDDLKKWETVSYISDYFENKEDKCFFHTQSLFEFTLKNGMNRLFLPIVKRFFAEVDALGAERNGHNTVVYYSDDGGYTWQESTVGTNDVLEKTNEKSPIYDIAECKMVLCDDGSLRLYNTRSASRFLIYFESFDGGATWSGINKIDYMQCAKSSFSIFEDPYNPMNYYLVWVNSLPISRGNTTRRTRLSLARSFNGKDWEFLCDIERFGLTYADNCKRLRSPIYQIVDPAVYVTKEYVYVTNGTVLFSSKEEFLPGSALAVHHEQRTLFTRIEKDKLKPQKWDSTTICDINLTLEKGGEWL